MADVRASDADRQRVIDLLRGHTADGRLTLDEFEERVGEALAARTHDDLRHVLRELPVPAEPVAAPEPAPTPAPEPRRPSRSRIPTVPAVILLVVIGSVVLGHFAWWLIPIGFWTLGGGCGAEHGHHHGRHGREPVRA